MAKFQLFRDSCRGAYVLQSSDSLAFLQKLGKNIQPEHGYAEMWILEGEAIEGKIRHEIAK